jgi:DNA modification methylase
VEFLLWAADHLDKSGVLVYNHKPRRRDRRMIHPGEWFLRPEVKDRLVLMEEIIWERGSTHNHGRQLMWPQTERLYVFRRSEDDYKLDNNKSLDFRSDVWRIGRAVANGHNAPFPLALAMAVIKAWSRPGELVCDPYAGSGTTGVAALKLGRRFAGAERLAKYHKVAAAALRGAA